MTCSSTWRRASRTNFTKHPSSIASVPWTGRCPRGQPEMPLNDCLSLFPAQALNRQELTTGWRMAIATLGEGEDRGFPRLGFDDDAWAPGAGPRLHGATRGNEG